MLDFESFDPEIHGPDVQLYELQTVKLDEVTATVFEPVNVSYEAAVETPWFYFVASESEPTRFNPNHDQETGQFAPADGGPSFDDINANDWARQASTVSIQTTNKGDWKPEDFDRIKKVIETAIPLRVKGVSIEVSFGDAIKTEILDGRKCLVAAEAERAKNGVSRLTLYSRRTATDYILHHEAGHALYFAMQSRQDVTAKAAKDSFNKAYLKKDGVTPYSKAWARHSDPESRAAGPSETFAEIHVTALGHPEFWEEMQQKFPALVAGYRQAIEALQVK